MTLLPFLAILISVLGLLISGGAVSFFMKYGTRLAMVEKESTENRAKIEKHATDLMQANTQVALVAAALESIKSALTELKTDVKQWMREHSASEE
jgi:membrane protein YqaA with SNARE-associated domain